MSRPYQTNSLKPSTTNLLSGYNLVDNLKLLNSHIDPLTKRTLQKKELVNSSMSITVNRKAQL